MLGGAALLTVLILAEVGLWVAQRAALSRRDPVGAARDDATRILCLGDSWTYGMESGDPRTKSYPARLQVVLNDAAGAGRFRVINRGRPGLTSRHMLTELSADLEAHKPSVVVAMVGPGNFFLPVGNQREGWSLGPLERSRVVAVIRLLLSPVGSRFAPPSPGGVKDRLAEAIMEREDEADPAPPAGVPSAPLRRAVALHREAGKWTAEAATLLRDLVAVHPGHVRAWRLLSLADLTLQPTVCALRYNLQQAKQACPTCPWVLRGLKILDLEVAWPGGSALQQDLANIVTRARLAGARTLLLNYPPTPGDPCSNLARQAVATAAASRGIPIIDMEAVLGTNTADLELRAPHWGEGHPNEKGYSYMAHAVLGKLKELGWIEARPGSANDRTTK